MTELILEKIKELPLFQQQELLDFAEYLIRKYGNIEPEKKRMAGSLKGFLIYMAEDFNAPLEDFKDYME
ncbi:MAG: DUF2281 domain-containing protein [Saprospiraceae bacterium]|jgi:hypothetical protein